MEGPERGIDAEHPTMGLLGDSATVRSQLADRDLLEGPGAIADGDPDLIVAVGDAGLQERLGLDTTTSTLPVGVSEGFPSVPPADVSEAIAAILAGRGREDDRPVVGVSVADGDRDRAVFDVTLVSDRPAHISEFAVRRRGETLLETRADGIVVATPAGSHGYARAAGGVRVATGTDALAIVPISAFATADERWITPLETLTVSVEREDTPVQVRADDRLIETVSSGATIEVAPRGRIATLLPPQAAVDPGG